MSLVEEVLAAHEPRPLLGMDTDACRHCDMDWPCETFRLATELQAAQQWREEHLRDWHCEPRGIRLQSQMVKHEALARYDEGRIK